MYLYTAFGDSITAGEGASSPYYAYPERLVRMVGSMRHGPAVGEILAEPGWTSAMLEAAMLENSAAYLARAKTITIWVGGDDIGHAALAVAGGAPERVIALSIRRYALHLATMMRAIRSVSKAKLIVCTQYNPFPNTPAAGAGITALNASTAAVAARGGAVIAPVHEWFAGRQAELIRGYRTGSIRDVLTSGHFPIHPNNRGHAVIAEGLLPLLSPNL